MPSASAKLEKQTSTETFDPVKQVLTIVEKKVRNLEKRKGKLDSYRHDCESGKELNEDQKKAVEKYDQVVEVLEFTKDLQKQFQTVIQDCSKAQKKAAKREQLERQQNELQRIKEIISYQDLLNSMGSEDIRNDFLNGVNGAIKLTEEELNSLDELYKAISPERDTEKENSSEFDEMLSAAAEHIQALLDSKNKEVFGTTYKALKETLLKIQSCTYFNKSEPDIPIEEEPCNVSVLEEKDESVLASESQYAQQSEASIRNETEEPLLPTQSGLSSSQLERPYYSMESASLYSEQTHPIQEVLSVQGNLNFLQESQIELESSRTNSQVPTTPVGPSYPNVQFSTASPSMAPSNMVAHCTRQPSGDASNISSSPATNNMVLANSASLQPQQVGSSIPATVPVQPTTQAMDFDPARPIPTQTYTNQSFSSAIHPMMAAAVSQNYVPVVTLPHAIPPPHVLTQNMVVQPLPPRSTVASSLPSNPNIPMAPTHTPVSGLSAASALSQQTNIYSLCLKLNQLSNENAQPSCVPSTQYECNDVQDSNMVKNSNSFVNTRDNRAGPREQRPRGGANNAYSRNPNQVGYGNEQAYQSTNNSQGFVNRDSFTDNSSYSSNLKRGLNSRGGSRGNNTARGTNNNRGSRSGCRN